MSSQINTETYTLPYYWANALINNDWSGYDEQETIEIREWLDAYPELGQCWTRTGTPQLCRYDGDIVDCLEFTFVV